MANDVRLFLKELRPVRTDREKRAEQYVDFLKKQPKSPPPPVRTREKVRDTALERTR